MHTKYLKNAKTLKQNIGVSKNITFQSSKWKNYSNTWNNVEKKTFLEVVEYTEEEGLERAKIALECGCDILMGTLFYDSINEFCKSNNLKYMPFVGQVEDRPSILKGSIDEMINEANSYIKKGVYGIDLLGYRYEGNPEELNEKIVSNVNAPVCIAGSINSYEQLDKIKK